MAMNKLKFAVAGILLAAAIIALVIQGRTHARLRAENESLRQQLDQLARLQADNETLSNRLARATAAADAQTTELLKLRNEVGMLRQQTIAVTDLQKKNQQLNAALASSRNVPPAQPPPEPAPKINAPDNAATVANPTDLGAIQLVNQMPSQFDLGDGKTCTLTPTINADGNYNIKVVWELQKADGQTVRTDRQMAEVTTSPGRAVALEAGGSTIAFTPTVNPAP
jgi:hypothetical protein